MICYLLRATTAAVDNGFNVWHDTITLWVVNRRANIVLLQPTNIVIFVK